MNHETDVDQTLSVSGVAIRNGTVDDAAGAARLWDSHLNWINVSYGFEAVVQRRLAADLLGELFLRYPSAVAELDGTCIGFAACRAPELGILEIATLFVSDPYRQQGVGQGLIEIVESEAKNWRFGDDGSSTPYVHTLLAYSSSGYYPHKPLPTGLFLRAGFVAQRLSPPKARFETELYTKAIGDGNAPNDSNPRDAVRHIQLR